MSFNPNSSNQFEAREEAIKLLFCGIQFPVSPPTDLAEDVARDIVKAADVLLNYIQTGKKD